MDVSMNHLKRSEAPVGIPFGCDGVIYFSLFDEELDRLELDPELG